MYYLRRSILSTYLPQQGGRLLSDQQNEQLEGVGFVVEGYQLAVLRHKRKSLFRRWCTLWHGPATLSTRTDPFIKVWDGFSAQPHSRVRSDSRKSLRSGDKGAIGCLRVSPGAHKECGESWRSCHQWMQCGDLSWLALRKGSLVGGGDATLCEAYLLEQLHNAQATEAWHMHRQYVFLSVISELRCDTFLDGLIFFFA